MIYVDKNQKAHFIGYAGVSPVLAKMKKSENGAKFTERLLREIVDSIGKKGPKPVLVLWGSDSVWLGVMEPGRKNPHREQAVLHLERCLVL